MATSKSTESTSQVALQPLGAKTLTTSILQLGRQCSVQTVLVQAAYFIFGSIIENIVPRIPSKVAKLIAATVVSPLIGLNRCIQRHLGRDYNILYLTNSWDILTFLRYTYSHKEFFQEFRESYSYVSADNFMYFLPKNQSVKFSDPSFNIKGYYKVEITKTEGPDGSTVYSPSMISIYGQSNMCRRIFEYRFHVREWREKQLRTIETNLWSVKIFGMHASDIRQIYYCGPVEPLETLELQYISTFFHPQVSEIWSSIRQMTINPSIYSEIGQEPQINLLLYGPPGTGKSNFAYRVARVLHRHIISINLASLDKPTAWEYLNKPTIDGQKVTSSKVVYVLDEFDVTVAILAKYQEKSEVAIEIATESLLRSEKSKEKETKDSDLHALKDEIAKHRGRLQLGDLLELLQGPTPRKGSIIIATTNKYEEIKEMCPALFRPGRLTPTYFGFFNLETLQEVSRFFFKQDLVLPTANVSLCPAEVMLKVTEAKTSPQKGFAYFSAKICEMIGRATQQVV